MYVPAHFSTGDAALVDETIDANSFATLVSQVDGLPFATHLPMLRERRGEHTVLLGHFARANPHWRSLAAGEPALAIFHGPHAYVSPRWYVSPNLVPTWNYAAVHCIGRLRIIDDPSSVRALIVRLVEQFEGARPDAWTLALEPGLEASMLSAIVAFEFDVERIEAKFKLGQNRSAQDRRAVLEAMSVDASATDDRRLAGELHALHALSRRALGDGK